MPPGANWCSEVVVTRARSATTLLAAALALSGCKGCKNDHPYVPYAIGDAGDEAADAGPAATVEEADAGQFAETPAEEAPPGATQWTLGGVSVTAPAGQVFALGLAKDLDGDGATDVVAIVRAAEKQGDPGTLVFYKSSPQGLGAPTFPLPGAALSGDARCTALRRLGALGKRSVGLELGLSCPVPPSREPVRTLAVVAFAPQVRVHFSAGVVDPVGAPPLFFTFDATDRDGDGIEDVAVRVALEGGGAPLEPVPRTVATLRWFDRPAGMSRDADEPDASLRSLAGIAAALAGKPKDAPTVPPRVRGVRSLYAALCSDSGSPRLVHVLGDSPLSCGPSRALEEAGLAETRAYATMGDAVLATTALARATLPPATKTPGRAKDPETWILQASPLATFASMREAAAVPLVERGKQPAWGALAFEPSGKLLVRTAAGVVRVDADTGDESEARDVSPWGMAVVSPDGAMRFVEAYNPCDGVVLHATLAPTGDGDMQDVLLPITPALGARCATAKGEAVFAVPLAWGAGGLEALVDGFPVLVTAQGRATPLQSPMNQPVSLGSPRSPGGTSFVVATSLGLVVRGGKARTLRAPDWDGAYAELRDCTVTDDGLRAACVRAGRVKVGAWTAP